MLFTNILLTILMLFSGGFMGEAQINNYFNYAVEIIKYEDNHMTIYKSGSEEFERILNILNNSCANAIEMPAYGVSLDNDTREAMKSGVWIELVFKMTYTHNDMPFDRLLIEINEEYTGINIIRRHVGLYEGRCFYLNLTQPISLKKDIEN